MAEPARHRLTVEEFYRWIGTQDDARFELVDGQVVKQAGATRRHDVIVGNAFLIVGNHLRGRPCRPFTSGTYIRVPAGNRRQADLGIDCGEPDDASLEAAEPVLVIEVPSPSTPAFDLQGKVEEYRGVLSLAYILLVDPNKPLALLQVRGADGAWASERVAGLDGVVDLKRFELAIRLADLYEGLEFRPRPALVQPPADLA